MDQIIHVLPAINTIPNIYYVFTLLLKSWFTEKPTLPKLINFETPHRTINICKEIGQNWKKVGVLLLNDENGVVVNAIYQQHIGNAENTNFDILQKWINGEGIEDCSWHRLLRVLRMADCTILARELENAFSLQQPANIMPGK